MATLAVKVVPDTEVGYIISTESETTDPLPSSGAYETALDVAIRQAIKDGWEYRHQTPAVLSDGDEVVLTIFYRKDRGSA